MRKPDLDRCQGVLLGLAAGDALGAGYEFAAPPTGLVEMKGGGLGSFDPGEWTDDTQQAICIAEEAATGILSPAAVGARLLEWYHSGPADVGIQTRAVLGRSRSPDDVAREAVGYFQANPTKSAGNGSLMRTAPVALAALGDDERLVQVAMEISALTHADPVAGEACALWCIAIDRAIATGTLQGVVDGIELLPEDRRGYWRERVAEVKEGGRRFSPNGYVVTAFQAALAAIWHTPVPEDQPCRHLRLALEAAVRIGDDTDTVAAIAGALLGAAWGASAVPVAWRALLHGKPGVYGKPDYDSQDLVRLGVLAANGGRPDSKGWPATDDLLPYYETSWPGSPVVIPLAEDPGVLMANIYGAVEHRSDVTISLCRMGRRQLDPVTHPVRIELGLLDSEDPKANPNLEFVLSDLAEAIGRWRAQGKTVMIHCVQAQHRTPALAAAYVAAISPGLRGDAALRTVCRQLPVASPNPAFSEALARVWPGGGAERDGS